MRSSAFPMNGRQMQWRWTGIQRVILHRDLFRPGEYARIVSALEGHQDYHLLTTTTDHMGEARVYAFLPGLGPTPASNHD